MKVAETVTYEQAKRRAADYMRKQHGMVKASSVGQAIWPTSELRAQGLGGAASRILKRMQNENLVVWDSRSGDWGWKLTSAGRTLSQEREHGRGLFTSRDSARSG